MTDRDRLIELIINADTYDSYECKLCTKDEDACDCCYAEKLADYLLANGVILLPCKVGDRVYYHYVSECESCCCSGNCEDCDNGEWYVMETKFNLGMYYEIGKTVFLTKEEAEKALKECEGNV